MKISRLIAAVVLAILLVPSVSVFAIQDARIDNGQVKMQVESKACEQIGVAATKLQYNLETKKQAATDKRVDKQGSFAENQQKRSDILTQQRQQWDANRAENFEKLRASAKTDEQKAAVEAYIAAVSNAVTIRRTAYEGAITSYRTDMTALLAKQRGQSDGAAAIFKSQIDQAVVKAKASCQGGTPVKDVLSTLKTDVQHAQNAYKQSRKTSDVRPQIEALTQTKRTAIKAATDTFLKSTEQARNDLKSAFGVNATSLEN